MARIQTLSLFTYLILQLLLGPSHAFQHRHLRRSMLYQGQGHVVDSSSSPESDLRPQRIHDIQSELDAKLLLRISVMALLEEERTLQQKKLAGHHHHSDHHGGDGSIEARSTTLEDLQQTLADLNITIQSLYNLLSSSTGAQSSTSSTTATSTATPSSTDAVIPRSSTTDTTTSTAVRYVFDPMSTSNVAVYYGQTDQTSNVPLSTVCSDPDVDIIILAFINRLSTGPAGYPTLNMGANCWAATSAQVNAGATGLIDCVSDGFANQVKNCQNIGKKVLLSIGGAVGYSETRINSAGDAVRIADNIWNLFGEGGMNDDSIFAIRPFGDVIVDGFDIDNEDGSTLHWPLLISTLRTHFQSAQYSFSYPKPYYLSAAPQCPRPDASIPLSSMKTGIDFLFIQFYNNPACNLNSAGFLASLQAWSGDVARNESAATSSWVDTANGVSAPRVYVGAPSFPAAGSGWVAGEEFSRLVGRVLGVEGELGNLGGVMLWDGAYGVLSARQDGVYGRTGVGRSYMRLVKEGLEMMAF